MRSSAVLAGRREPTWRECAPEQVLGCRMPNADGRRPTGTTEVVRAAPLESARGAVNHGRGRRVDRQVRPKVDESLCCRVCDECAPGLAAPEGKPVIRLGIAAYRCAYSGPSTFERYFHSDLRDQSTPSTPTIPWHRPCLKVAERRISAPVTGCCLRSASAAENGFSKKRGYRESVQPGSPHAPTSKLTGRRAPCRTATLEGFP